MFQQQLELCGNRLCPKAVNILHTRGFIRFLKKIKLKSLVITPTVTFRWGKEQRAKDRKELAGPEVRLEELLLVFCLRVKPRQRAVKGVLSYDEASLTKSSGYIADQHLFLLQEPYDIHIHVVFPFSDLLAWWQVSLYRFWCRGVLSGRLKSRSVFMY